MHRAVGIVVLAGSLLMQANGVHADAPRVVIARYGMANEAPHMIACGLPGAWPYAGFGYSSISFPVEAEERSVDIAINDDFHDLPVMAFVTQSEGVPYPLDPDGTWVCGSSDGIPISSRSPLHVTLMQAVTAPPIRGSVRAAFHEH